MTYHQKTLISKGMGESGYQMAFQAGLDSLQNGQGTAEQRGASNHQQKKEPFFCL